MANVSPQIGVVLSKADGTAYDLSGVSTGAVGAGTSATAQRVVIATDDLSSATKTWVQPARITTNAASETVLLAAATATKGLIIANVHASEPINIAIDNTAATSTHGIAVAAGRGLAFALGEVPAGKISGYTTNAGTIEIAYI